jgi:hypothetical protein
MEHQNLLQSRNSYESNKRWIVGSDVLSRSVQRIETQLRKSRHSPKLRKSTLAEVWEEKPRQLLYAVA